MSKHQKQSPAAVAFAFVALAILTTPAALGAQVREGDIAVRDRSSAGRVALRVVQTGLVQPWSLAPLPGGGALVTERGGRLRYLAALEPGAADLQTVAGVPEVHPVGQGGLLDVVPSPDFDGEGWVYLSYADRQGSGYVTAVARGWLEGLPSRPRLSRTQTLFQLNRPVAGGRHFGSRLVFDRDGYLYITIGDRGEPEESQDAANHQGTVVRINPDGSVPADNPRIRGAAPGVFTWGHRNPQGAARNPRTGDIWVHEHGPRGGDEINILRAGANYGWPRVTFGVAYSGRVISEDTSLPGLEDPLLHWTPSIAPSGMAFVTSGRYGDMAGDLLVGALVQQHVRRVQLDAGERPVGQEVLFAGFNRIRDIRQAPDGYIYVLTDDRNGAIYRLELEGN